VNEGRGGVLLGGEELCQPVGDGWSTAAVGRCPDHRGSAGGDRKLYFQLNVEQLSSYQVVVVAYSNDLVRMLRCSCHPLKLVVFSFAWNPLRLSENYLNGGVTLLIPYIPIYPMVKTIRVSEEYHEWLNAHKEDDETMEETLRRMTRGPHPSDVAGLLSEAEAESAKEAVDRLRSGDRDRFDAARSAFEHDGER